MLIQIRNVLAIAILSALIVPSGVLSQQPPSPPQPPENSEQRSPAEHETTNNAEHPPRQTPFVLDFLSSDGLQEISTYCANKPDNEPDKWLHEKFICDVRFTDVIVVIFTVLLAFVTAGLIWVGLLQILTVRRQLRAYVFVSNAKIVHGIEDDGIPEALIVIKNSGQTPAYKVMGVSGLAFNRYPPPPSLTLTVPDQKFLCFVRTRMDLGPGDTTSPIALGDRPLTSAEKASVIAWTSAGWIYGEIRYRDAFRRKRWTKYRMIIGGPFGVGGGQLVFCEEGNKAA